MAVHYERLSAMDAMFLEIEDRAVHMHIGSVALFDAAPLLHQGGGLDVERILAFIEAQLHKAPRLRQKLATIPRFERPVWVDDRSFNLLYHVRHTALPQPGDVRQLKRLAGRILSQQLDRGKPLWETWLVEGVEGDRFGVVTKLHHCMADGISSGDLLSMMMGTNPDYAPGPMPTWIPRVPPGDARLVADELARRATGPLVLANRLRQEFSGGRHTRSDAGEPTDSGDLLGFVRDAARGAWRAAQAGLRPRSETPLNVEIGPHRRFDWTQLPLDEVKRIGHAAGGTVNDVVLGVVAGAVRSFLGRRGAGVPESEFRVAVPVNLRSQSDRGVLGNRVASLVVTLPIAEADPWRRLLCVAETTKDLKRSGETQTVDLVARVADFLPLDVIARISRAGSELVNMVVTNVPGPPVPVYLLGAHMLESYPVVPLTPHDALNIALFSYEGALYWGFNADWEALPDLHEFVESVPAGFEELAKAAEARA